MAYLSSSKGTKSGGAKFPKSKGGTGVRVSPGKGGAGKVGPTHCTAKRAAPNVSYH